MCWNANKVSLVLLASLVMNCFDVYIFLSFYQKVLFYVLESGIKLFSPFLFALFHKLKIGLHLNKLFLQKLWPLAILLNWGFVCHSYFLLVRIGTIKKSKIFRKRKCYLKLYINLTIKIKDPFILINQFIFQLYYQIKNQTILLHY